MWYRRGLKLRWLLFLAFTLISAVPVFLLAIWVEHTAVTKEFQAVNEKHLLLAKNLSGALSRYAYDVRAGFHHIASNLSQGVASYAADDFMRSLHIQSVAIYDADFDLRQALPTTARALELQPDVESLKAIRQMARERVGDVVLSDLTRIGDRPYFLIAQTLPQQQIALGTLTTDYLIERQQKIVFGKRGHSMIVDRRGHVVAHPNQAWQAQSKDASKLSVVQAMMRGETGVSQFYSPPMQADMIAGHTAVEGVGWGVMVPQPIQELTERARSIKWAAMWLSALGIAIAGMISWWLARILARPIETLQNATYDIANGDFETSLSHRSRRMPVELQDLTQGFNQMVTRLNHAQSDLRDALTKAETANQAKSEFLANMSHELRTPLHAMLGFSELGMSKLQADREPKIHRYFEQIFRSSTTLLSLLDALLDLSKLDAGKMTFEFEQTDLNSLVQQGIEEYGPVLAQHHLRLVYNPPPRATLVRLDPARMLQVLRNLLSNAIKFSPADSTITLQLEQNEQHVSFCIQDCGPGIPASELDTIFDKFVQSSLTKTGAGGTGLGLAICRELIVAHQGQIWATNHPSGGAVFYIQLPAPPTADHDATATVPAYVPTQVEPCPHRDVTA